MVTEKHSNPGLLVFRRAGRYLGGGLQFGMYAYLLVEAVVLRFIVDLGPLALFLLSIATATRDHDLPRAWTAALLPVLWPLTKLLGAVLQTALGIPFLSPEKAPSRWATLRQGATVLALCVSFGVLGCLSVPAQHLS